MKPGEHLRIVWDRRWFIVVASILVAAAALAWSSTRPKVYEAEAVVDVLSDSPGQEPPTEGEEIRIVTDRITALTETTSILREGIRRSGLGIAFGTARERVSAEARRDVGFVTIRATGPSPGAAEALVQGTVRALIGGAESGLVVSPARAAPDPIAPRPARDATLAFLLALLFTTALAGTIRGRVPVGRVRAEVERLTQAPVLARIPRKGRDDVVEAFRELRTQVEFARAENAVRSVVVTAVEPGVGGSFVARGLAQISANLKASVVLVDANLRRPSVAMELHLPASPGLGDVLLGRTFDPSLLPQANPLQKRYRVLTAGLAVPDAPGLLGAGALRKLIDQLDDAEIVVVDAPPATEVADALVLAAQVDASILVVDARRTRRRDVEDAIARLRPHGRFLGSVINRDAPRRRRRQRSRR